LVTHDALKFFHLMLKRNGYVLEQLFSPLVVMARSEHEELKAIGSKCITRHHSHHYRGSAETQWKLLTKEFRLSYIPDLIASKIGGAENRYSIPQVKFHSGEYQRLLVQLERTSADSHLPDESTGRDDLNDLLVRLRVGRSALRLLGPASSLTRSGHSRGLPVLVHVVLSVRRFLDYVGFNRPLASVRTTECVTSATRQA
jgi:uncharacterized protein